jgi:Raf kinase inhibitor-like YbhB/YbcL family protein
MMLAMTYAPLARAASFKLASSAFKEGAEIPKDYTSDGKDQAPPLAWSGVPAKARQLALICDDPDAPTKTPWVHWVAYGVAGDAASLQGSVQGKNSWGTTGWRGPQPPAGSGWHHYHFKLYASDQALTLPPGATKEELLTALEGHVVGTAELVGKYRH